MEDVRLSAINRKSSCQGIILFMFHLLWYWFTFRISFQFYNWRGSSRIEEYHGWRRRSLEQQWGWIECPSNALQLGTTIGLTQVTICSYLLHLRIQDYWKQWQAGAEARQWFLFDKEWVKKWVKKRFMKYCASSGGCPRRLFFAQTIICLVAFLQI